MNSFVDFLSLQANQPYAKIDPIAKPSTKYPVKITNQRRSKNVMSIYKIYQNTFISQI